MKNQIILFVHDKKKNLPLHTNISCPLTDFQQGVHLEGTQRTKQHEEVLY